MRQFYQQHRIPPTSVELEWSDYVELFPINDEKTRKRLEARIIKEDLATRQIRRLVQTIQLGHAPKPESKLSPLKRPADLRLQTFAKSNLCARLNEGEVHSMI